MKADRGVRLAQAFGFETKSVVETTRRVYLANELYPDDDGNAHCDPAAWPAMLARAKHTGYTNRFSAIRADIVWRPALFW